MIKKITLLTIIALFTIGANAQINFGVKAGLNMSNMTHKDKYIDSGEGSKLKPGFHIGLTCELKVFNNLSIESDLLFSTKGTKEELITPYNNEVLKTTTNLNYLELPVSAKYKFDLGGIKAFINAGPYLGYAFSGKFKSNKEIYGSPNGIPRDETPIKIGREEGKDDIKARDFGLKVGFGVEINRITLGALYGLGLANLAPYTEDDYELKNKGFSIYVGFKL